MKRPVSGEQIELVWGDQRAVVVEVGGGLRSYELGERPIIVGYGVEEICNGSRGQILLPWPNRLKDGRYEWAGRQLQLDINEVGLNTAIHGLLAWRNWSVAERDVSRVVVRHALHATPGYPFELECELIYELGEEGLTLTASAVNAGEASCPFGFGFHPYLAPPGLELIDDCEVRLPADTVVLVDRQMIPCASEPVAGGDYDFRDRRAMRETVLDHCFFNLLRDGDDLARATIAGPAGTTTLWADASCPFLQVFSGEALSAPQRRRALAVEPMTCAPNAFVSGQGLITLAPGEQHVSRCGITPS